MQKLTLKSFVLAFGLLSFGGAGAVDSWYWNGTTSTNKDGKAVSYGMAVQAATNWVNAATGAQGIPQNGDIAIFDSKYPNSGQTIGNDAGAIAFGGLIYNRRCDNNQGMVTVQTGGPGVQLNSQNGIVYWNSEFYIKGTGEFPVYVAAGGDLQIQKNFKGDAGTVLVKTGPGRINVFCNGWNQRTYTVPKTLLRGGTFQIGQYEGNASTGHEFWFDSNDPALCLKLFYIRDDKDDFGPERYNWVIKNGALRESAAVQNHEHEINSTQTNLLVFTGTPTVNPMTFTGRFTGNAGLKWAPSNDSEFVLSGGSSTSSGKFIVNNGTVRVANAAHLASLESLLVDGASSVFAVDGTSCCDFTATKVTLANGGKLSLAEASRVAAGSLTVDGETIEIGFYSGTAADGVTAVDWITGSGVLRVGAPPEGTATANWIAAGTGNVSAAANWEGGVVPELGGGTTKVVVASSVADSTTMTLDRDIWVRGVEAQHKKWLTVSGEHQFAVGSQGFATAHGSRGVIDAPTLLTASQQWSVVGSGGMQVMKDIAAFPGTNLKVAGVNGAGWIDWCSACPVFWGSLTFTNLSVRIKGTSAFGPAGAGPVYIYHPSKTYSPSFVNGAVIDRDLCIADSSVASSGYSYITVPDNATLTFNGAVYATNSTTLGLSLGKGSKVTFNKLFMSRNAGDISGSGTAVFNGPYHNRDRFAMTSGTVEFHSTGNRMNGNLGTWNGGTVKLMTDYALEASNTRRQVVETTNNYKDGEQRTFVNPHGKAVLDLCGHDQSVDHIALHGGGGTVTSDTAATMYIIRTAGFWAKHNYEYGFTIPSGYSSASSYGYECMDRGYWKGGVSMSYSGTTPAQRFMMRGSTSTGCVEVVKGKLVFLRKAKTSGETFDLKFGTENPCPRDTDENGSWVNASAVIVKGGELELEHGKVFGRQTDVRVEGGKIVLDAGVSQKVRSLTIGGVEMLPGIYGSSASAAENKNDTYFAGTGVLKVGRIGYRIIVR